MNKLDQTMNHSRESNKLLFIAIALGITASSVTLVLVLGIIPPQLTGGQPLIGQSGSSSSVATPSSNQPSGAVIVEVPWKHLMHIDRFQMKNQEGEKFDTADLEGRPYVVSFFFSSCPSICRDLNDQIDRLNKQLRKEEITFVSITVDPEVDKPKILKRYAQDYDITPDRWAFVTDQMYKIKQVGEQQFGIVVDKDEHTDNILLVDKWGRYRDRFKWNDPYDMKRFVEVAKEVCSETKPPLNEIVRTRNAMVGFEPLDLSTVLYLREFHLTQSNGKPFFSRDLTGEVWIGNFFFTSCPGICKEQTKYLSGLQSRLTDHPTKIVSITTDPVADSPTVLSEYSRKLNANPGRWLFLTGQTKLIPRIGSEYFKAISGDGHHSSLLFVVDRWANVRGQFDWRKPEDEVAMQKLIEALWAEEVPPAKFELITVEN